MRASMLLLLALSGCGTIPQAPLTFSPGQKFALPVDLSKATMKQICGMTTYELPDGTVCNYSAMYCLPLSNGSYTIDKPPCSYSVLDGKICEGTSCVPGASQ